MSKIKQNIKQKIIAFTSKKQQLAFCTITGISISIETPAIQGYALEYKNPYSILKNAIDIGKLPFASKNAIPKSILAGCLLTLLSHYNKIADKLSAAERNITLQEASPYALHSMLSLFAERSKESISYFPSLSLTSDHTSLGVSDILMNYYKAQTSGIELESKYTITLTKAKKEKAFTITSTVREELKAAISLFLTNNACNAKLASVLKLCGQQNHLLEISQDIFDKMIAKLMDINSVESISLADLFTEIRNKKNVSVEETLERFSDAYQKPLTLAEIIAKKIAIANGTYTEEKETNIEENEEDEEYDEEMPIFPHLDCANCIYEKRSCMEEIGYCYALKEQASYQKEVAEIEKHESIVMDIAIAAAELGYTQDFIYYNKEGEVISAEEAIEDEEVIEEDSEEEGECDDF